MTMVNGEEAVKQPGYPAPLDAASTPEIERLNIEALQRLIDNPTGVLGTDLAERLASLAFSLAPNDRAASDRLLYEMSRLVNRAIAVDEKRWWPYRDAVRLRDEYERLADWGAINGPSLYAEVHLLQLAVAIARAVHDGPTDGCDWCWFRMRTGWEPSE